MKSVLSLLGLAFVLLSVRAAHAGDPVAHAGDRMVVHEWGTFTALQDEQGRAISGINTDDEPVPAFVHNLRGDLLLGPTEIPNVYFKGTPRVHPDVIVRLETPVIYFYPPKGAKLPLTVDVDVAFRGGWLTQFYPDAKAGSPGMHDERFEFGALRPDQTGTLAWRQLSVGVDAAGPETTCPAWLAPRQVPAASVKTPGGEAERYLFYRGVGNVPAPLAVSRDASGEHLMIRPQLFGAPLPAGSTIGPLWLVDVRSDASCAFARYEPLALPACSNDVMATIPAQFSEADYGNRLAQLRKSLHEALIADGLYPQEADALLNTWETSYFKRAGMRLFFMVPRPWTDHVLPLRVSGETQMTRSMVGRIELVTPHERELLARIAAGPVSNPQWVNEAMRKANAGREDYYREEWYQQVFNGTRPLSSVNLEIPDDYRAYLELGRFRNALILDEANRRPSQNLTTFIERYDLKAHSTGAKGE